MYAGLLNADERNSPKTYAGLLNADERNSPKTQMSAAETIRSKQLVCHAGHKDIR